MLLRRISIIVLIALLLLALPSPARADIAPPAQPPGANPVPGDASTQVRMQAETVLIAVQPSAPTNSFGRALVTADFTMRNLGAQSETMAARFPISASDGWSSFPEIKDLRVQVDGKGVSTRRVMGEDPRYGHDQVPWMEFDITFPAGVDVQVRVMYTLEGSGESPFVWFNYFLSTGAAWRDTIGSADLIVRLPYAANAQNVLMGTPDNSFDTTPGGTLSGNEVRWHYDNLEPTTNDDFEVDLVMPTEWEKVLTEQSNVEANPKDGEAWGRLGKLYKEMAFSSRGKGFRRWGGPPDAGAQQLYTLSVQAYEKAVTLKPKDALWHAGFADLLAYHAYFGRPEKQDVEGEAVRALQEIRQAIALAPGDQQVRDIATEIWGFFPDGIFPHAGAWEFPWLTETPLPTATLIGPSGETPAAPSTAVSIPATMATRATVTSSTPTTSTKPIGTSTPAPSLPFCGSAVLFALVSVVIGARRRG